jgi:hypothetical protein
MTQQEINTKMADAMQKGESIFELVAEIAKPYNEKIRALEEMMNAPVEHNDNEISFEL